MFVNPGAYGRRNRPIALADVEQPAKKYLLADCVTAYGFDMDTIAYLRYPNYDPSLRQKGWYLDQFTALGRVAWPDGEVASVTRHVLGNNMLFADGHAKWLRHDQIPNNDGPHGREYPRLKERMVPWQPLPGG
jgi:prepilin-type processing-associated H-X9-DG protein